MALNSDRGESPRGNCQIAGQIDAKQVTRLNARAIERADREAHQRKTSSPQSANSRYLAALDAPEGAAGGSAARADARGRSPWQRRRLAHEEHAKAERDVTAPPADGLRGIAASASAGSRSANRQRVRPARDARSSRRATSQPRARPQRR